MGSGSVCQDGLSLHFLVGIILPREILVGRIDLRAGCSAEMQHRAEDASASSG